MTQGLAKQLEQLKQLNRHALQALWLEYFGQAINVPSRREFVILLLAYRLQEKAYGGLSAATRKRLRAIAAAIKADPDADFLNVPRIKTGARLIREWQGKTHQVGVVEDGFVYGGRRFKSLSEIARLITGTRWSGPLFFGLKKDNRKESHAG